MLLHGFLCDSRCWRAQLAGLADDFKVVAWDAPGAGASPDPDEPFTITDWAHALADFLDAVGITRTHLLGLSWGGMLAQELFRLHPSRVDRLLLADTYAGTTDTAKGYYNMNPPNFLNKYGPKDWWLPVYVKGFESWGRGVRRISSAVRSSSGKAWLAPASLCQRAISSCSFSGNSAARL